ncbi:MAG TPA: glycosyltransferase family 4 protein [Thermoanaerobaculia bacterium]|nr:glycosyltransferase family 4 protein [Thermoanaerobaculia bacterium]
MRVLLIANTLPPTDLSGAGEQVLQLRTGLEERGHLVRLLGRGPHGVPGPKALFPVLAVIPALIRVRRLRPDVVQIHESDGGLVVVAARALSRLLPPAIWVALQQVSYHQERRAVRPLVDRASGRVLARPTAAERRFRRLRAPLHALLGRWSARLADRVLAPSRATASELERDYGARATAIVPNATGAAPATEGGPGWTAEPAADEGPFLLYVGRLRIRKGIEVLLDAMVQALPSCPDLRLLVVGGGERARVLRREVGAHGLADCVALLGRRDAWGVGALLRQCRALVVPSTYEGMPLVILEAMAAGAPVVASAVSGIPEVVVDGETGWLVPAERPAELAEALRQAWHYPDEARRRGRAGTDRLERRYRPRHAVDAWLQAVTAEDAPEGSR